MVGFISAGSPTDSESEDGTPAVVVNGGVHSDVHSDAMSQGTDPRPHIARAQPADRPNQAATQQPTFKVFYYLIVEYRLCNYVQGILHSVFCRPR